jgi:hypothetical protein
MILKEIIRIMKKEPPLKLDSEISLPVGSLATGRDNY